MLHSFVKTVFLLSAMQLSVVVLFAQDPGSLDSAFGTGGLVTTHFAVAQYGGAIAIQPDGKIIMVGKAVPVDPIEDWNFGVVRYNIDGTLDTTFGNGGALNTDLFNHPDTASSVAVQSDGKIVVAGNEFDVARYNPDGTLDISFGKFGKVILLFPDAFYAYSTQMALQPDGKIVLAGYAPLLTTGYAQFALLRLNENGIPDSTFGIDGRVMTDLNASTIQSFIVQPDGKIVAVGRAFPFPDLIDPPDFVIARYNSDGSQDPTFGVGGRVYTDFGIGGLPANDEANDIFLQPDGRIVVVGDSRFPVADGPLRFVMARYNIDGSLDVSFGTNGKVATLVGGYGAVSNALQQDGKILVVGNYLYESSIPSPHFVLLRYNSDGTLDSTFGTNGQVTTDFTAKTSFSTDVALQSDGRIVVAGTVQDAAGFGDFAVARYIGSPRSSTLIAVGAASSTYQDSAHSIVLSATVSSTGMDVNQGTLRFQVKDGDTLVGSAVTSATLTDGAASVSYTLPAGLAARLYTVTASYTGGPDFAPSNGAGNLIINAASTGITLSSSQNPSTFGQAVTFTAAVSSAGGIPTGIVEFRDGTTIIGNGTLTNGVATLTTAALGASTHSVTARYVASTSFSESVSTAATQMVNPASTVTSLSSTLNPSRVGQAVTFTAAVAIVAPGAASLTGAVDFYDGSVKLNSKGVKLSQGEATFTTSALTKGNHTINAIYSGSNNVAGSTSSAVRQQVKP